MFSSIVRFSSENAEKVVKPPQIPTWVKSLIFEETLMRSKRPANNPIKKEPKKFITRVFMGKSQLIEIRLIAYRQIAPIAPPIPTKKNVIHTPIKKILCIKIITIFLISVKFYFDINFYKTF